MFFSLTVLYAIWWVSFVINKKIIFDQNAKKINSQYYIKNYIRKNVFDGKSKVRKSILKYNKLENKGFDTDPNCCNDSNACKNEYYKSHIEKIYNDLNSLATRDDKTSYIIQARNQDCKDYYIPIDRKKFTNKNIFDYTKKQKCYINELGSNVQYVYINKCNSNVYMGVDIERRCLKNKEVKPCQDMPNEIPKLTSSEMLLSK